MNKLIYGVGFNDRKYPVFVDGRMTRTYNLWRHMLERCYSSKYPTYVNCTLSNNFKGYSYFHEWALVQVGYENVNFHLDKDIIHPTDPTYSEDKCVFVPPAINCFFSDSQACRGLYPVGVHIHKSRRKPFESRCWFEGRRKSLGYFETPEEAYQVYKEYKEQLCKDLANQWKLQIDPRVYEAMMVWTVKPF